MRLEYINQLLTMKNLNRDNILKSISAFWNEGY